MENTRFMTAIEEPSRVVETKLDSKPGGGDPLVEDSEKSKSDLIDFAIEPVVKVRKPRGVDKFFADQSSGCLLSPIKPGPSILITDPAEESLDLKLEGSDCPTNVSRMPKFIGLHQPRSECPKTFDEDEAVPCTEGPVTELTKRDPKDDILSENVIRKRPQDDMEPAVFDLPRASKILHREQSALPEFCENSAPVLQFTSETDNLFKPRIGDDGKNDRDNNDCDRASPEGGLSTISESPSEVRALHNNHSEPIDEEQEEVQAPEVSCVDKTENYGFNKTFDMTLRTSGGAAFAAGLFLAIDEALDPIVGAIVPYGRRQRGVNTAVLCIPLLTAIYYLFFRT